VEAEGEVLPRSEVVLEVEAEVDSATAVVEEVVHLEVEEVEEAVMEVVIEEATVDTTLVLQMKCLVRLLYPISEALKREKLTLLHKIRLRRSDLSQIYSTALYRDGQVLTCL
jgi:hypothetical protein